MKPDFMAQAVSVNTALYGGTKIYNSGTSFASPLMAGSIAAMIQGLRLNGIDSTPSLIKSQLYDHCNAPINITDPYTKGMGIANFSATYLDLKANGSTSVHMTPDTVPYSFQMYHHRGSEQQILAWMSTAVAPDEVSFSVSGNISGLIRIDTAEFQQQFVPLSINSDRNTDYGNYTGEIIAETIDKLSTITISIIIQSDFKGNILFDNYYTDWDNGGMNRMFGENTGDAIGVLWRSGYYLKENNQPLSNSSLNDFDILWLDDLFPETYTYDKHYEGDTTYATLFREELMGYIARGGSAYVDFIGKLTIDDYYLSDYSTSQGTMKGTSKKYNIYPRYEYMDHGYLLSTSPWELSTNNFSTMTRDIDTISHWGNYMDIIDPFNESTYFISQSGDELPWRNGMMAYDYPLGGKIIFSSDVALRYPGSVDGSYIGGDSDILIFKNMFDWLIDPLQPSWGGSTIGNMSYSATILANDSIEITYTTERGLTGSIPTEEIGLVNGVMAHQFNISVDEEDLYHLMITCGDKYLKQDAIVDVEAPWIEETLPIYTEITLPYTFSFKYHESFVKEIIVADPADPYDYVRNEEWINVTVVNVPEGESIIISIRIMDTQERYGNINIVYLREEVTETTGPTSETESSMISDETTSETDGSKINIFDEYNIKVVNLILIALIPSGFYVWYRKKKL
jgi:hypothetical protein